MFSSVSAKNVVALLAKFVRSSIKDIVVFEQEDFTQKSFDFVVCCRLFCAHLTAVEH
jgi:hypothetical protein